jgi:A/G-specific adenine glycosylase
VRRANPKPDSKRSHFHHPDGARAGTAFRRRLLVWFDEHRRELPWRRDRDPYRIWVSEVMLQQTQVVSVIPFFERFVQAFPSIAELAAADLGAVLRLWEGLGYYRRARNLHEAARRIVADHAGRIPDDPERLQALPGLGRYTCNAILSQAFDRRLPILEANSQRVLARLYGVTGDPRRSPGRAYLWKKAQELLPTRRAGDFNQALMELGALVCLPASPRCSTCPLASSCEARQRGLQNQIPPPRRVANTVAVEEAALVVWKKRTVLLVQRPASGQWAGLWEFPHGPKEPEETHEQAALRCLRDRTGIDADVKQELMTLRHGITRFRITLTCFEATFRAGSFQSSFYVQSRWVRPEQLAAYPVSAPQRRLAKALAGPARQRRMF